jgi:hypothetical protein
MNKENFLVDDHGNKVAVMLPIKQYSKILEALEELEDIKAYDAAKAKKESTILLRDAIKQRKQKRNA